MPGTDRNDFANLILLCYVHHRTIDGNRWKQYSVALLRSWKSERESARGSELRTLRDISEDQLQALIVSAIASRNDQIQQTLSRLERNDAEAAGLLRDLTDEIAELRGRGSLLDPDAVSMVENAAYRLGHLPDTASWLNDAAGKLSHLQDTATSLYDAAGMLSHLEDTANLLSEVARQIESAAAQLGEFDRGI